MLIIPEFLIGAPLLCPSRVCYRTYEHKIPRRNLFQCHHEIFYLSFPCCLLKFGTKHFAALVYSKVSNGLNFLITEPFIYRNKTHWTLTIFIVQKDEVTKQRVRQLLSVKWIRIIFFRGRDFYRNFYNIPKFD